MPKTNDPPLGLRKLRIEYFLYDDDHTPSRYKHQYSHNDDKVAKNQQEYGQKKRIKPWRTGTKSQQQIAPKGFTKGFRG